MRFDDYELLVAAHLFRNREFLSDNADLMEKSLDGFFDYIIRDIARYVLEHFKTYNTLLPKGALLADTSLLSSNRNHPAIYHEAISRIWQQDLEGEDYVRAKLLPEVQRRTLSRIDLNLLVQHNQIPLLCETVEQVQRLSAAQRNGVVTFAEGVDEILETSSQGIRLGLPTLEDCMPSAGLNSGEILIVEGEPNIGKSHLLYSFAREAAVAQMKRTLVVTLETSRKNTLKRIYRGVTGWTNEAIAKDPVGFKRALEPYLAVPLHVVYYPSGSVSLSKIDSDIDRIEQKTGEQVEFVVRDYGELMQRKEGHEGVRAVYSEFKALLGKRGIPGADATQKNRMGHISYFDLRKDGDIAVSIKLGPSKDLYYLKVERNREGEIPPEFLIHLDKTVGRVHEHTIATEE